MNEPDVVYFLREYNFEIGILISRGPKASKIQHGSRVIRVDNDKVVSPDESLCVVWEQWKGRNGRGSYRLERHLYQSEHSVAKNISRQPVGFPCAIGRVTELEYGKRS